MARSVPIVLDSFSWPTKNAAEVAFRNILQASGYNTYDRITDPAHDLMLREVLDRHPDRDVKIGTGVDYFFIGRTRDDVHRRFNVGVDAIGFWIQRVDGTKVDFSYLTAIRNNTPKSNAKESLRIAVTDQRLNYRASRFAAVTPAISDISGILIPTIDQAQVIYLDPTWAQLTFRFAVLEGGWDNLATDSGNGAVQIGSRLVDPAVEARWVVFHERHAKLGIATASEAAQRSRGDEAAWVPSS